MKIHKKGLGCGTASRGDINNPENTTDNNKKVTCKKCIRLIKDEKAEKLYDVSYECFDGTDASRIVKAPTASKAIYKCFKMFRYDGECYSESIGVQFQWFRNGKPKAKLIKDENVKPSLTEEEQYQLRIDEAQKRADEFNTKYPIGTKVLFQGDGRDRPIITTTKSLAQTKGGDYLLIFLDGVSGSYLLDDRFVRVLTDENKDLESLR